MLWFACVGTYGSTLFILVLCRILLYKLCDFASFTPDRAKKQLYLNCLDEPVNLQPCVQEHGEQLFVGTWLAQRHHQKAHPRGSDNLGEVYFWGAPPHPHQLEDRSLKWLLSRTVQGLPKCGAGFVWLGNLPSCRYLLSAFRFLSLKGPHLLLPGGNVSSQRKECVNSEEKLPSRPWRPHLATLLLV